MFREMDIQDRKGLGRMSRFRLPALLIFVAISLGTVFTGTSGAYSLDTSLKIISGLGYWEFVNGCHNWTQAQMQNWGATDGNGGGYNAYIGITMWNNAKNDILGSEVSTVQYPVSKKAALLSA